MKTGPATEYALLGAMMDGPKHGYEILQFLGPDLGSTWRVSTSQLYALLKRLERAHLLESKMETQDTRPSKRVFSLTSKGSQAFLRWLHSPTEHVRDLRIEFLAKLFFFDRLTLDGAERLVEAQIGLLERIGKKIRQKGKGEKIPYKRLVFGFKDATLKAWAGWLSREALPFARNPRERT